MSETKWQDIETAPKDGTAILLASPWMGELRRHIGTWNVKAKSWMQGERQTGFHFVPHMQAAFTHWQPLPPPPSPIKEE